MLTAADNQIIPVLLHDTDAGQPCLVCREDCPGLEIHFWRKICINCKCPVSDHQATNNEQITQVRRGKQLDENVRAQFECSEYTWIPPGLTTEMVEEYMKLLPPQQRPVLGTVGEQYRRKLLMTQLPGHDHTPSSSLSPAEAEELVEFSRLRYELSYGVAEVKRVSDQQSEMFDCRTCQSPLEAGQLVIITERAGPNCIWCVTCFKCDVCEDALVDLHFFYKDGELFCGRHHAELLKPRCAACDELILAKEYTLAEDKNWHIDHFCCWECDSPLGGQRYVTRDDHPFCILCYEELFAPPCKKCQLPIGLDSAHMVHRDFHWHATESCFFCENCQVSLITSPFLLKSGEIFCSSSCAQEYSLSQLADKPVNKVPQIEIIEDNPVDRNSIQSILRKESTPSPPKVPTQNGVTPNIKKVMFDVEQLGVPLSPEAGEIRRSMSEEEFEYLEESLNTEYTGNDTEHNTNAIAKEESTSPLSESSLSTSPLSDSANADMFCYNNISDLIEPSDQVESNSNDNDSPDNIIDNVTSDIQMNECVDQDNDSINHNSVNDDSENDDLEQYSDSIIDNTESEHIELELESCNHSSLDPAQSDNNQLKQEDNQFEQEDNHFEQEDNQLEQEYNHFEQEDNQLEQEYNQLQQEDNLENDHVSVSDEEDVRTPVAEHFSVTEQNSNQDSPGTPEIVITDLLAEVTKDDDQELDKHDKSSEVTNIISSYEITKIDDPVSSDKENDRYDYKNAPNDNAGLNPTKPPKKPARGKLSSSSFNRVLRKIDHTGNDSLFVERPGKRLRNRPRSLSSFSTNTARGQNTIEQKDNLVNMFALAPDIADMIANVYKNTDSVNSTIKSDTYQGNRTIGSASPLCSTGSAHSSPRAERSLHKRNPSYEAAELVLQMDVESEGEEQLAVSSTKQITVNEDAAPARSEPVKSPKKGIKARLSFKKKKEKIPSPQKPHNPELSPRKQKKACIVM